MINFNVSNLRMPWQSVMSLMYTLGKGRTRGKEGEWLEIKRRREKMCGGRNGEERDRQEEVKGMDGKG